MRLKCFNIVSGFCTVVTVSLPFATFCIMNLLTQDTVSDNKSVLTGDCSVLVLTNCMCTVVSVSGYFISFWFSQLKDFCFKVLVPHFSITYKCCIKCNIFFFELSSYIVSGLSLQFLKHNFSFLQNKLLVSSVICA
jgi:hypothetical protein